MEYRKIILSSVLTRAFLIFVAAVSSIWVVVEFLIYLAKDVEFNWWSLVAFLSSTVLMVVITLCLLIYEAYRNQVLKDSIKQYNINKPYKKSKFQERLDKMVEEHSHNKNPN